MEQGSSHQPHIEEGGGHDHHHQPHTIEITGETETKVSTAKYCGLLDTRTNSHDAKKRSASMKKLWMAVVLCIIFMTVEIIGGIKANSLAILTDAAHLLSDVAAFAISLFSLWAAGWEATPRQSYGFYRIEILGTLVSIQLIWLLTGIIVYEAIVRMINGGSDVDGMLMFLVAAFGFVVNVTMAFILGHDHGHSHDHDHGDHEPTVTKHGCVERSKSMSRNDEEHKHNDHGGHDQESMKETLLTKEHKEETSVSVRGAYLHVLGDSIQSIGVMIGGALIWWKPKWKVIDLICTILFSIIVLWTTIRMVRSILEVLMESTPRDIDSRKLEEGLLEMEEVEAVHELHIWAITVGKVLLACHVKITPQADADMVLDKVIAYIEREYNISHVTVQIER